MISDILTLKKITHHGLLPQEEMLEMMKKKKKLIIGIPKEISFQENRVALVPEAVSLLVSHGHEVRIEADAGLNSHFLDSDYSEVGGQIYHDRKKIFECSIILKVAPILDEELDLMPGNQTIISALQVLIHLKKNVEKIIKKKITAIAWDYIRDNQGFFPIIRSMGEIVGNTSILIGAQYLSDLKIGKGMMFGNVSGVEPSEVVILGSGTVGEFATLSAISLGASVKVFDNSLTKLRRLQKNLGKRIFTSIIQPKILSQHIKNADLVIGAIRAPLGKNPCVVTEEIVSKMSKGSVIVDVSIDQGGCFETSQLTNHQNPIFRKYDVVHYCVPNIASRVPQTASIALSNIFSPILLEMADYGGCKELIKKNSGFRSGVYIYNGRLCSQVLGKILDLPYNDIELLLVAM